MQMRRLSFLGVLLLALLALPTGSAFAQNGKLKIRVTPKQAYTFVDGNAIREGRQTISLSPGKHTVTVANYGYKTSTQDVNIEAGKTADLNVTLESYGGPVTPSGYGKIIIKGDRRAAVLLNGKTPDYFVGHVDEFDWDWLWHQELLVPPGTHQVTVTRDGKELFSGPVTVAADQKLVIEVSKGGASPKTSSWKNKATGPLPRFKAGTASTTVVVAPAVINSFTAAPANAAAGAAPSNTANINCSEAANLNWATTDAPGVNISNVGDVASSGSQSVSPRQTTTYTLTARGPGGVPTQTATVNVNTAITSTLDVNPLEVKFRKIGEKIIQQDSSTVTWTTTNADQVSIDPLGSVTPSGNQTVKPTPQQTAEGPVDEKVTYTLKASNVCGGSDSKTAALHITGSIEPIPNVVLSSTFYPTAYPDATHPESGLLRSQQDGLKQLADGFKKYLEYDPSAKLSVEGFADKRGSKKFNLALSERRVERVKDFLVQQRVSVDHVETAFRGNEVNLDVKEVKALEDDNPNKPPKKLNARTTWLAYNRRVDIVLEPSDKKPDRHYPHNAADASVLWQLHKPTLKTVEKNQ